MITHTWKGAVTGAKVDILIEGSIVTAAWCCIISHCSNLLVNE